MLPAILLVEGMRTCEILLYLLLILIFLFLVHKTKMNRTTQTKAVDGTDSDTMGDHKFIVLESQLMMLLRGVVVVVWK